MRGVRLVAVVLLAGCVSVPSPGPGARDALGGFVLPWELLECRYFIVDVPADVAALETRLPAGFALDADASPLAPVSGNAPYLGVEAFLCADGSQWASFYTPVVAPENLTVEEHLHFVMWDTLVDNASRQADLAGRGFPVRSGSVAFSEVAGPLPATRVEFELGELGAFVVTGAHAQPGSPFGGEFVEYMEAEDGSLSAWRTDYQAETLAVGEAVVEPPAGSWIADVIGERARGAMITGTWSFTNGTVSVPPSFS